MGITMVLGDHEPRPCTHLGASLWVVVVVICEANHELQRRVSLSLLSLSLVMICTPELVRGSWWLIRKLSTTVVVESITRVLPMVLPA